MAINKEQFEQFIFGQPGNALRFTQDSPVYPDVWKEYFEHKSEPNYRADLILTPHKNSSAAQLFKELSTYFLFEKLENTKLNWQMASSGDSVVAKLTLKELITIALPMTNWWQNYLLDDKGKATTHFLWLVRIVHAIEVASTEDQKQVENDLDYSFQYFKELFRNSYEKLKEKKGNSISLWSINRNRTASISIEKSVPATKADAGRRLFDIDGSGIFWAILDSGIDARHPAFRKMNSNSTPFTKAMEEKINPYSNNTRILATYDFTKFRQVLTNTYMLKFHGDYKKGDQIVKDSSDENNESLTKSGIEEYLREITSNLENGRTLDWSIIAPLLRIAHNEEEYLPPTHPHGTHVAGIIAANLPENNLIGMCPAIELYDIRVIDSHGEGQEFNILAAIQFLRWLNNQKDSMAVHGVNMSISMTHDVASYACGQTPICTASEKLVSDGTIVVAAAGNLGQTMYQSKEGTLCQGFRMVNITDPGNAERVITVGATHRNQPHAYGVSYFSSKGPTGDGRIKPDLVAPGEKIVSTGLDDGVERMDGTSMAAPHVSGAAALLLAKHRELIGRPDRIKQILCSTATDLGREKYFQGCGMLDVLRAIQSV